jgi:hypothetical protein
MVGEPGPTPGGGGGGGAVIEVNLGSFSNERFALLAFPNCCVVEVENNWLDSSISKLNVLSTRS